MSKRRKIVTDDGPLSFNPFAVLGSPSASEASPEQLSAPEPAAKSDVEGVAAPGLSELSELRARLVVRRQKKGQGGKTVTCVEGVPAELSAVVLARLKRELGCSGRVKAQVLIAGTSDHSRVADWLRRAGARVTLGN